MCVSLHSQETILKQNDIREKRSVAWSDNPLKVNYQKPVEFRERVARDGNPMTNLEKYKHVSILRILA